MKPGHCPVLRSACDSEEISPKTCPKHDALTPGPKSQWVHQGNHNWEPRRREDGQGGSLPHGVCPSAILCHPRKPQCSISHLCCCLLHANDPICPSSGYQCLLSSHAACASSNASYLQSRCQLSRCCSCFISQGECLLAAAAVVAAAVGAPTIARPQGMRCLRAEAWPAQPLCRRLLRRSTCTSCCWLQLQ